MFWKSHQLYIISVGILQLVSVVHETCLSLIWVGFLQVVQWLIYHCILNNVCLVERGREKEALPESRQAFEFTTTQLLH